MKAFLRGDSPPFSADELEMIGSNVKMRVKVAKKLSKRSRYWVYEYLRRQPKGIIFRTLIIKFKKYGNASLLLLDVRICHNSFPFFKCHISTLVFTSWGYLRRLDIKFLQRCIGLRVGDELEVEVEEANARNNILSLIEVAELS